MPGMVQDQKVLPRWFAVAGFRVHEGVRLPAVGTFLIFGPYVIAEHAVGPFFSSREGATISAVGAAEPKKPAGGGPEK